MSGNVGQWVLDEYAVDEYKKLAERRGPIDWKDAIRWPTKLYPRAIRGGSWDADAVDCRCAARRGSDDNAWRETDPNSPKSPWWFTEPAALSVGFRIIRPLDAPPAADRGKFWDADINSIRDAVSNRLDAGRGARGLVDPELPKAEKKYEKEQQGQQ